MVGMMLANVVAGFLAHVGLYHVFERNFTKRTSRLMSYATGLTLDMVLSWFTMRQHEKSKQDRRQSPCISFDKYIYVRAIAALTLGAGVVFGYMLDRE